MIFKVLSIPNHSRIHSYLPKRGRHCNAAAAGEAVLGIAPCCGCSLQDQDEGEGSSSSVSAAQPGTARPQEMDGVNIPAASKLPWCLTSSVTQKKCDWGDPGAVASCH